jgi:hypothetical protein
MLKNLQEATESQDTVLTSMDVTARKVEIEQTSQMLQEAQKAQDKAIAKTYKQLRNLLSGDAQSQLDCVCCEMRKRDLWAAVNSQVTKGRRPWTWMSLLDCLELHKLTVLSANQKAAFLHSASSAQAPEGHGLTAYLANGSVEWLCQTPPYVEGWLQGCTNDKERFNVSL